MSGDSPVVRAPRLCPVCDTAPRPAWRMPDGVTIVQCPVCRLAWWDWPAFEPRDFYDHDYFQSEQVARGYNDYAALEPGLRRTARARLKRLERLSTGGSRRLLDLGCGTGVFLAEAVARGWHAEGVEVSPYAAERARGRGVSVRCEALEAFEPPAEPYDCVTLWDTIEHVRDPRETLRRAALALRPGGVLGISTGDVTSLCARLSGRRWHLFNLPEHLFFFSPESLRRLLDRAGLGVERISREVFWSPASYLVERLCKPLGFAVRVPGALRHWVFPATLFDILGVYARRRDS